MKTVSRTRTRRIKARYIGTVDGNAYGADIMPTRAELLDGPTDAPHADWRQVTQSEYDNMILDARFENGAWIQ